MNWIFETYSNVYGAAMMQSQDKAVDVAYAKNLPKTESAGHFGLFRRR